MTIKMITPKMNVITKMRQTILYTTDEIKGIKLIALKGYVSTLLLLYPTTLQHQNVKD
jgi:hypothetical protein